MEKEILFAIGTVFGTVVGAVVSLITTKMNTRSQLTLARENHKHEARMEGQKLAHQQQQESREQLRGKCEEAHQLLSKIRTDLTPENSYVMRSTGTTRSNEPRQKSYEDVRRLLMIADLYFLQLQEPVQALGELTIGFWNNHETIVSLDGVGDSGPSQHELSKTSREISAKVIEGQNTLREVATSLSIAGSSAKGQEVSRTDPHHAEPRAERPASADSSE